MKPHRSCELGWRRTFRWRRLQSRRSELTHPWTGTLEQSGNAVRRDTQYPTSDVAARDVGVYPASMKCIDGAPESPPVARRLLRWCAGIARLENDRPLGIYHRHRLCPAHRSAPTEA